MSHRASKWQGQELGGARLSNFKFCSLSTQHEGAHYSRAAQGRMSWDNILCWLSLQPLKYCERVLGLKDEDEETNMKELSRKNVLQMWGSVLVIIGITAQFISSWHACEKCPRALFFRLESWCRRRGEVRRGREPGKETHELTSIWIKWTHYH